MPLSREHCGAKKRGGILPFLHRQRSFLGSSSSPKRKGVLYQFQPPPPQMPLVTLIPQTHHPYQRWLQSMPDGIRVIHPSRHMVATGETPQPTTMPRAKRRTIHLSRTISISPPPKPPKAPLPPRSPLLARTLALARLPTLPHGFARVVACLKTPEVVEVDQGMPVGPISIGMVSKPWPFKH